MRVLSNFIDKDSYTSISKDELEKKYIKILANRQGSPTNRKDKLENSLNEVEDLFGLHSYELQFLNHFINLFDKFIVISPEEMMDYIQTINFLGDADKFYTPTKGISEFSKIILKSLDYEGLGGGPKGKDLARMLNIKSCLYCNSQFSFSYKHHQGKISKLQLDHFFSMKKFPFFSISLYNLIPSCSYCNQKKSDAEFNLKEHCHPYLESISDRFVFSLSDESEQKILLNYKISENDIELIIDSNEDEKVSNHDELFDLSGIYNNHKDIVVDILRKGKAYPRMKINEILSIKDEDGNALFANEADFKRIFLNMPLLENEINSSPLTKLKQDFAKRVYLL